MVRIPPSLKHRRFFYLWLGLLISIAGTQMQICLGDLLAYSHID